MQTSQGGRSCFYGALSESCDAIVQYRLFAIILDLQWQQHYFSIEKQETTKTNTSNKLAILDI